MPSGWGGRRAQEWSRAVLGLVPADGRDGDGRPLCVLRLPGCLVVATTADHIIPRAVAPDLAFDVANGQPACGPCNSRKGARVQRRPVTDGRGFFDSAPPRKPRAPVHFSPNAPTKSGDPTRPGPTRTDAA